MFQPYPAQYDLDCQRGLTAACTLHLAKPALLTYDSPHFMLLHSLLLHPYANDIRFVTFLQIPSQNLQLSAGSSDQGKPVVKEKKSYTTSHHHKRPPDLQCCPRIAA